jgi:hypothetical protein
VTDLGRVRFCHGFCWCNCRCYCYLVTLETAAKCGSSRVAWTSSIKVSGTWTDGEARKNWQTTSTGRGRAHKPLPAPSEVSMVNKELKCRG